MKKKIAFFGIVFLLILSAISFGGVFKKSPPTIFEENFTSYESINFTRTNATIVGGVLILKSNASLFDTFSDQIFDGWFNGTDNRLVSPIYNVLGKELNFSPVGASSGNIWVYTSRNFSISDPDGMTFNFKLNGYTNATKTIGWGFRKDYTIINQTGVRDAFFQDTVQGGVGNGVRCQLTPSGYRLDSCNSTASCDGNNGINQNSSSTASTNNVGYNNVTFWMNSSAAGCWIAGDNVNYLKTENHVCDRCYSGVFIIQYTNTIVSSAIVDNVTVFNGTYPLIYENSSFQTIVLNSTQNISAANLSISFFNNPSYTTTSCSIFNVSHQNFLLVNSTLSNLSSNITGYGFNCSLTTTDVFNTQEIDLIRFTQSINNPPTVPDLLPSSLTNFSTSNATLACTGSSDPDGDAINVEFYLDQSNPPVTQRQATTATTYVTGVSSGGLWYYRCRANDNDLTSAYTSSVTLYFDFIAPSFAGLQRNTTSDVKRNDNVSWLVTINDDMGISHTRFSHNLSGFFTNESLFKASSTSQLFNFSKIINVTKGTNVCGRFWANDTLNNSNESSNICFTVINSQPQLNISFNSTSYEPNDDIGRLLNYSDIDGDSSQSNETHWFKNGTEIIAGINRSILVNYGNGNYSHGDNITVMVRSHDGTQPSNYTSNISITINDTIIPSVFGNSSLATTVSVAGNITVNVTDTGSNITSVTVEVTNDTGSNGDRVNYTMTFSSGSNSAGVTSVWSYGYTSSGARVFVARFWASDFAGNTYKTPDNTLEWTATAAGGGGGGGGGGASSTFTTVVIQNLTKGFCGDNTCSPSAGEDVLNCPQDCSGFSAVKVGAAAKVILFIMGLALVYLLFGRKVAKGLKSVKFRKRKNWVPVGWNDGKRLV